MLRNFFQFADEEDRARYSVAEHDLESLCRGLFEEVHLCWLCVACLLVCCLFVACLLLRRCFARPLCLSPPCLSHLPGWWAGVLRSAQNTAGGGLLSTHRGPQGDGIVTLVALATLPTHRGPQGDGSSTNSLVALLALVFLTTLIISGNLVTLVTLVTLLPSTLRPWTCGRACMTCAPACTPSSRGSVRALTTPQP
jgi:hypothetical protein